ncbi:MAG: FeoB-associated Cys-rich membrane protein [Oscillospiraceae bacterium]|jgi:hypothetical protein|nr:FeoB-associated Cys-rich membrane protein [Oscillospiraceae bacterium]
MLSFFVENIGTILTGIVLLGVVALIVRKIVRDRRKNVGCGCGCSGCDGARDGQKE